MLTRYRPADNGDTTSHFMCGAGATQKAIGRHFGLSQAYVSKLLKEIA